MQLARTTYQEHRITALERQARANANLSARLARVEALLAARSPR
jgi:uncharacterized protein YigA (DUF484 family)